ncbi:hypothetical protein J3R83DRAFT_12741 [Lanmaoa asiatica]|nr:hypothetical protein J3R83DRAFT_12741 [Lanmaoa asiatica]
MPLLSTSKLYQILTNSFSTSQLYDDDNDDRADGKLGTMGIAEMLRITEQMEGICISRGKNGKGLDLSRQLRQFRIELRKEEAATLKQRSLHQFWGGAV